MAPIIHGSGSSLEGVVGAEPAVVILEPAEEALDSLVKRTPGVKEGSELVDVKLGPTEEAAPSPVVWKLLILEPDEEAIPRVEGGSELAVVTLGPAEEAIPGVEEDAEPAVVTLVLVEETAPSPVVWKPTIAVPF
jgi:hypothetical protein